MKKVVCSKIIASLVFCLLGVLVFGSSVKATTLSDLPFSSVIQIQPTDTYMCNDDSNCTATTPNVLPFKFVKMQARQTNTAATPLGNVAGYTFPGDGKSYTYWMLLDNYCWWGKSDCRYYDGTRQSRYASWNANSDSDYSNNITITKTNNILNTLANFYDSLPNLIGGLDKADAIANFTWDMYGVSNANPPAVGFGGGTWTNKTYDPNNNPASQFVFTGSNTAPVMTSRIGLISFHEWQGSNTVYSTNPTTSNTGNGGSYCYQRFGTANCAASSGYMFNDANTAAGNQTTVASATNPRPRYPWTRSPDEVDSAFVWNVFGRTGLFSLGSSVAIYPGGVSPALWLSSNINLEEGGDGSYENPYNLIYASGQPISSLTSTANWNPTTQILTVTGNVQVANPSGEDIYIRAAACNNSGQCTESTTGFIADGTSQIYSLSWNGKDLPAGDYNGGIWVEAITNPDIAPGWQDRFMANETNPVNFSINPRNLNLTVAKNRPFNITLGDAAIFNLTPGTNSGVTVAVDTNNQVSVVGTLSSDSQITFGPIMLSFKTLEVPTSVVVEATLN